MDGLIFAIRYQQDKGEQNNAPDLPIGRFLKSKSLGGNLVILIDYEVLVWQVTVATIFDFCFGPTFSWSVLQVPAAETIFIRSPYVANKDSA